MNNFISVNAYCKRFRKAVIVNDLSTILFHYYVMGTFKSISENNNDTLAVEFKNAFKASEIVLEEMRNGGVKTV